MDSALSVSVIIPVYNGGRYLAEAIDSTLAQTRSALEVLVVDDGSTDSSADVARRYGPPVRLISLSHAPVGGAALSRNRGAAEARGELLAFLDADDVWLPDKLARQVDALAERPEAHIVLGLVEQFISPELDQATKDRLVCPPEPVPGYLPTALLVRRAAFLTVGGFDPQFRVGEFMEWTMRARALGLGEIMLPHVVARRRLHTTNQGVLKRDARRDYVAIVKATLDRRRSGDG